VVIFGVPGLKVHSKLFLISRKEEDKVVQYAHIGTGNFNENTAKIYCDHSLLTANKKITQEVEKLFSFYTNNYKTGNYNHLIVSPFNTRKKFNAFIAKEIKNAKEGKEAWITLKMNSFADDELIEKIYEASNAGVKIKLIVRGICMVVPGIKGKSENIEIISIVDRFLEHSRVYIFCQGGNNKYYIASGDWMYRNLDFRSEVAVPILDPDLQQELKTYIDIQLSDNCKARKINTETENVYVSAGKGKKIRSQEQIYQWIYSKRKPPTAQRKISKQAGVKNLGKK
jgi:polyphosphate kinase